MTMTIISAVSARLILIVALFSACFGYDRQKVVSPPTDQELLDAAEHRDLPAMQRLVKNGADVNARNPSGESSLMIAAGHADIAMTGFLLGQKRLDENAKAEALFHLIRVRGAFLKSGQAEASENSDPFLAIVKLLLEKGVPVEARDEEGSTPLISAAAYGQLGAVKVLLRSGADLEARNGFGSTALLAAACDCAIATMPDTYEVMKLLLEKGANINARDHDGNTPLIIASTGGVVKTKIVQLLIEHSADLLAKNNNGETALDTATKDSVPDVIRLLKDASVKDP